ATYLRTVLRSTPNEAATSAFGRPAYQCTRISVTSITVKLLLAIGFPRCRTRCRQRRLGTTRTRPPAARRGAYVVPMGNSVIGVGNYLIARPPPRGIS